MLLEYADGSIAVIGLSNRPAEAARMGYLPRTPRRPAAVRQRPRRPRQRVEGNRVDVDDPWVVADRLLESLLDEKQRENRRRYGRWWVKVDRGWLQMGANPHDIRFRPHADSTEWSLCIVSADRTLPPGDVWSTLLLTATAMPVTFFRVANWSPPPTPTSAPRNPPNDVRS